MSFSLWFEHLIIGKSFSFVPLIALVIPFFSIFRLAKFNIDTRQSESFIGLNTPANTIFFTSFPLLCFYYQGDHSFAGELVRTIITPSVLVPLIIIMSFMLVSEIPFFSFKFKHFKWNGNELRFLFLQICLL